MDATEAQRERRLFSRLHDPSDPVDADVVLRRYLPLARRIAARFRGTGEPFDDLLQVASLGLLKAIRRFDPQRGTMFSSFATPTVLGELRRHFRDTTWFVHVPRELQELALRVDRGGRELTVRSGRPPTVDALADALGCSTEEVVEGRMVLGAHRAISFETPRRGDSEDEAALIDTLGDEDAGFGGVVERGALDMLLRSVPVREREILRLRYYEDLTQGEIGRRIGVSQMQVSRILRQALGRLQAASRGEPALAGALQRSTASGT
ncbi:MAG TPA: SigB/SigF/SigG family RNA polymerase sigma factor [Baekduia sp.]|uniref:SigB/SigF/SigG family RNA polymerase sigma factor n=1 Tax=Baekduia sp. TaxID=2600305 RepID=UPI002B8F62DA|nr:SigB/SigF/SigG family RNA polymerase sigma factor [Baekduia sp.]HMJ35863.1 SigB/SigF/SigG family RNA polymerase sigma factor [Baekduia sp.]